MSVAIKIENGSGIRIEGCTFSGFETAIHAENCHDIEVVDSKLDSRPQLKSKSIAPRFLRDVSANALGSVLASIAMTVR